MSITSSLDIGTISAKAIAALKVKLPALSAFSISFAKDVAQKGVSVSVPLIGAKTGGAFSGNYTTDGSNSVTNAEVLLDQSTDSVTGLTDIEFADTGLSILEKYIPEDIYAVAKTIIDHALELVTVANYTNEYVELAADFDIETIIGLNSQAMALGWTNGTILLNATAYSSFLADYITNVAFIPGQDPSTTRFLGFNIICYPGLPTTETLIGICCNPVGIAVASRPVSIPPNAVSGGTTQVVTTDPNSGISFGIRSYYSDSTGRQVQAVHQVHGAGVGLTNGLIRICWSDQINSTSSLSSSSVSSVSSLSSISSSSSSSSESSVSSVSSISSSSESSVSSVSSLSSISSSSSSSSESSVSSISSSSSSSSESSVSSLSSLSSLSSESSESSNP